MKNFIIAALLLGSFSAFAGFACNDALLMTGGDRFFELKNAEACQKALAISKNGFTCAELIDNAKITFVTQGEWYKDAETPADCLKALRNSNNGFACIGDTMLTHGAKYTYAKTAEDCQKIVDGSRM